MNSLVAILAVLALCAAGALVALLQPFALLYIPGIDDARRSKARRHMYFSGFILLCAIASFANLSFAGHALNVVATGAVMICMGLLAMHAFDMRQPRVAVAVGLLSGLTWLIGLLLCLQQVLFEDNSPVTVQLSSGVYCRATVYGFVTSDSGDVLDIYRRYLFIDHRIYRETTSMLYPNKAVAPPAGLPDAPARCHALINAQRRAQSPRGGAPTQAARAGK